jgi:hypothetical protein
MDTGKTSPYTNLLQYRMTLVTLCFRTWALLYRGLQYRLLCEGLAPVYGRLEERKGSDLCHELVFLVGGFPSPSYKNLLPVLGPVHTMTDIFQAK